MIELKNGKVQRSSIQSENTNQIRYYRYSGIKGLFLFIFDSLAYWENLVTVIYIILHAIVRDHISLTMYYPIIILIVNFVVSGLVNFVTDFKQWRACNNVNNRDVSKFVISKKSKGFEIRKWGSLQTGDIIKIKENEEFPADVLILDVMSQANEHKCFVRGGFQNDLSIPSMKRSCEGTQNKTPGIKIPPSQFVDQISGLVKFEYNYNGFFSGTYKLNNSPAAFELTMDNVAVRGSYLCQTKAVICLVLNVGTSCISSIFKGSEQLTSSTDSYFEQKSNSQHRQKMRHFKFRKSFDEIYRPMYIGGAILISIFILISLVIVFTIRNAPTSSIHKYLYSIVYYYQDKGLESNKEILIKDTIAIFCGLLVCLPLNYKLIMDIISLMNANFAEWDYNTAPADLNFDQFSCIKALGKVSDVFISKSAIMNNNVTKVRLAQVNQKFYFDQNFDESTNAKEKIDQRRPSQIPTTTTFGNYKYPLARTNNDETVMNSNNNSASQISREEDQQQTQQSEYLPNQLQFNPTFVNYQLDYDFTRNNQQREPIKQFMRGLCICHNAQRRKEPSKYSKSFYKSIYSCEQAQLMFAHSYGLEFINKKKKTITISNQGNKERYDIIVVDTFQHMEQLLTVAVIKPFQTFNSGSTLYVRGPLSAMFDLIEDRENERHEYLTALKNYSSMGLHPVMVAAKNLTNNETHELEARINEAMSLTKFQELKIENSLLHFMQDLEPLGILGLQEVFNLRDCLTVTDIVKNGVKVWMLSKDDEAASLINMNAMRLMNKQSMPLIINGESEKAVEEQIKLALQTIASGKELTKPERSMSGFRLNSSKSVILSDQQEVKVDHEGRQLIISGQSLKYIFRDEQLLKYFLTVTTFCDLIIGCSMTSAQKLQLHNHVKYFHRGSGSYSLAVIGSAEDQSLILNADISVTLRNRYQQSDNIFTSDIIMKDFYALSYLMFKHGTISLRRIYQTTLIFIYRTLFLFFILLFYICRNGFSAQISLKQAAFIIFLILVSNFQILIYGISFKDVGYDYFYRIFGEYKRNFLLSIYSPIELIKKFGVASMDILLFIMIQIESPQPFIQNGMPLPNQGYTIYNGLIIYIIFSFQLTNTNEVVRNYHFIFAIMNIFGIIFMLDDEELLGIRSILKCTPALFYFIFVILFCTLRNYAFDVLRKLVIPSYRDYINYYSDVEDKLFLEEFEDPDQEFTLKQFEQAYKRIQEKLSSRKLSIINQNLIKVQRSDSVDLIIEKINQQLSGHSAKKIQDQTILNWFTLKFVDKNKEIEYQDHEAREKIERFRKVLIVTLFFNLLEFIEEIILSSTGAIPFVSFYFYLGYALITLLTFIISFKLKTKTQYLFLVFIVILSIFYSFCYFYMDKIEFTLFMNIAVLLYMLNGGNVRCSIVIGYGLYILVINFVNAYFKKNISIYKNVLSMEQNQDITIPFIAIFWFIFISLWSLYIYWEEKHKKLEFWMSLKMVKEFSKLKSILHLLMPAFVRERIRQGQRFIADDQGEVTIIFIDIADFDNIVQMFTGRELCEFLDHLYNAMDQLCEHHALQKIETVGKTYMACGGLKQCEKKFDQRLLQKHHSERIIEFAFNIQSFVNTQHLKDGTPVKVKIGIHSGHVISGVVGENKPQFSLVGDTVNKTSRVCGSCLPARILTSRETHRLLETHSNRFYYDKISVFFKGIGQEDAFYVHKRRFNNEALQLQKRIDQIKKKDGRSPSLEPKLKPISLFATNKVQPLNPPPNIITENQQLDTSRSLVNSDQSDQNDPLELLNNSSDSDSDQRPNDSFNNENLKLQFGDKDDRQIQKNPLENSTYNLVERPGHLLSFTQSKDQKHIEDKFRTHQFKSRKFQKFFFLMSYMVFNKVCLIFYALEWPYHESREIFAYIYPAVLVVIEILVLLKIKYLKESNFKSTSRVVSAYFILTMICLALQSYKVSHDSRLIQIYLIQVMIAISIIYFYGALQLLQVLITYLIGLAAWITVVCVRWEFLTVKSYSFFLEILYYVAIHVYNYHANEMRRRKMHNNDKIMEIEIKRTNDLLSNLVPPPVLLGIKNDQKVVDELEDVTLLFTDMVKFTDFSKSVKSPKEVVKLLSELFTRFDSLCVQNQVYKVHTIGDCYVILGYTGHIPQSERTPEIKAQEAWNVIKTGFEMINIIADVREHSDNESLKELDMRIGIHTGKIVAGIIGTKIVRYDIFGTDVLIANKMESNGIPGAVVISEDTKKTLEALPELYQSLNFIFHKTVKFDAVHRQVEAFKVEALHEVSDSDSSSGDSVDSSSDDELQDHVQKEKMVIEEEIKEDGQLMKQ